MGQNHCHQTVSLCALNLALFGNAPYGAVALSAAAPISEKANRDIADEI